MALNITIIDCASIVPQTALIFLQAWFYEMASDEEYMDTYQWMQKVNQNRMTFNAISDGSLYNVYPNATIVRHPNNIERHGVWKKAGYKVYPCVAGLALDTIRLLIDQNDHTVADAFIGVLVNDAQKYGYDGINIDFEAYGNLTDPSFPPYLQDGIDFAAFLSRFARACHKVGIALSVDTDTPAGECEPRANGNGRNHGQPCPWYTRLYNWDSLAVASRGDIDKVITMSTYTWGETSFMNHILWMTWFIEVENTGIGLCPWCIEHAKVTPTQAQLKYRFDTISKFGFNEIDVWMVAPDPKLLAAFDLWNPFLADFLELASTGDSGSGSDSTTATTTITRRPHTRPEPSAGPQPTMATAHTLTNATCLNGAPATVAAWLHPTPTTDWVIQIGSASPSLTWCISEEACRQFATPPGQPPAPPAPVALADGGPQSQNCTINPTWCGSNQAVLTQCSMDMLLGDRTLDSNGTTLHFDGRRILAASLQKLATLGLRDATRCC